MFPDDNTLVNNACKFAVYRIASDIKAPVEFWLKGEKYSLSYMLNNEKEYVDQFVSGTVYQAFLSAISYHRWHSPINGTVVRTELIPGTYYAESPATGFPNPDPAGPNLS